MPTNPAIDPLAQAFQAAKAGRLPEAEQRCRALIAAQPDEPKAHALLARVLMLGGRHEAARGVVDAALALAPNLIPALIEAAGIARVQLRHGDAVALLRRLIALQPAQALLHVDLAASLVADGQVDEARQSLATVLRAHAKLPPALMLMGSIEFDAGNTAAAADWFRQASAAQPQLQAAWINLGESAYALDRYDEALQAFERADRLQPNDLKTLDGCARTLWALKADLRRWLAVRERIAAIEASAPAWTRLGMDYWKASLLEKAHAAYQRGVQSDPNYLPARWGAFQYPACEVYADESSTQAFLQQWREQLAWFEAQDFLAYPAAQLTPCVTQCTNFYLHYLGEPFVEEQRRYARVIERMVAVLVGKRATPPARPRDDRRIRVAFASGFIREHTMLKLFGSMVTGLSRESFEVSVFHTANLEDSVTASVRTAVDWFDMGERSIEIWTDTIRARDLDVLVYLDIGMHPLVQALAAQRLAPVQCMLWGHPVTSGFAAIDWFLTSDLMEAPGGERNYLERVHRLPGLATCYAVPQLAPAPVPELRAVRDPSVVHAFFGQSAYKIMPFHDDVLARIIEQAPNVRLCMTPFPQAPVREALHARMAKAFAARGLDLDAHLTLFRFVTQQEFLGIAQRVDFNLDSIGWSGGNTTLEILMFDVPTLTLPGPLMRSRHTYAMLKRMELDELIARDVDDYVGKAVRLARDADWRAELRAKIAARKQRLFDDRRVIDALASFLQGVVAPSSPP